LATEIITNAHNPVRSAMLLCLHLATAILTGLECYKVVSRGLKLWIKCSKSCLERSIRCSMYHKLTSLNTGVNGV